MTDEKNPQINPQKNPQMTCLMALFDSALQEEMFMIMELAQLKNYTHFVGLHGSSNQGKKEGTVAWPGTNEILMIIVSDEQYGPLKAQLTKLKHERVPSAPLLIFTWPLKEIF